MQQQNLFNKIFNPRGNEMEVKLFVDSVVKEHPYFGLAHFYALKNTAVSAEEYFEASAKTSLFFNNTFFLNAQLQVKDTDDKSILKKLGETENTFIKTDDNNKVGTAILDEHNNVALEENKTTAQENTLLHSKIENYFSAEVKQPKEILPVESEILFEPLHASDYFASQGIKLSEDAFADDKLGKQLKSFTAWLKTMKKVHAGKLPAVSAVVETAVQNQAEKSNVEEDIVTEPMAEAYLSQNKEAKAIEIYNKLSLLNPLKKAYFAAKIDSLKK